MARPMCISIVCYPENEQQINQVMEKFTLVATGLVMDRIASGIHAHELEEEEPPNGS